MLASAFDVIAAIPQYEPKVLEAMVSDRPLLLLLGVGPDFDVSLRQAEIFKHQQPLSKVALLADNYEPTRALAAFAAGVDACLNRHRSWAQILKCLELVMLGEAICGSRVLTAAVLSDARKITHVQECMLAPLSCNGIKEPPLSPREGLILQWLVEGSSNKIIARRAAISEATVKVHMKAILRKVNAQNRTQAAIWAVNNINDLDTRPRKQS
jgi:two-component system nitrate/nitrite response regulator NarL